MRDWLIIGGTLLILIVLFDGIRRTRNARYGNIRMSPSIKKRKKGAEDEPETKETPSYTSELPNGGARVVGRRDSGTKASAGKSAKDKRQARAPEQASLNLGDSVPLLMEEIQDPRLIGKSLPQDQRIEPTFSAIDDQQDQYEGEDYEEQDHAYEEELEYDRNYGRDVEDHGRVSEPYEDDASEFDDEGYEDEADGYDDEADGYEDEDYEEDYEPEAQPESAASQNLKEPDEVLIINVMAHKGEMFNGGELLDVILKCGMRFGDMDIFHRHADTKGEGALLFSMANMVKPGTFDLDAMDQFETPGVSLFMTLPLKADSMQSFELMLETANRIADALDGELKDEQRSVMTRQTLEHCRQRILDFERRRLFQRPR